MLSLITASYQLICCAHTNISAKILKKKLGISVFHQWHLLKMAEEKLLEAQSRADELIVKQESIDNFLSSLKQGAGTKQVIEWQKKLEELRYY